MKDVSPAKKIQLRLRQACWRMRIARFLALSVYVMSSGCLLAALGVGAGASVPVFWSGGAFLLCALVGAGFASCRTISTVQAAYELDRYYATGELLLAWNSLGEGHPLHCQLSNKIQSAVPDAAAFAYPVRWPGNSGVLFFAAALLVAVLSLSPNAGLLAQVVNNAQLDASSLGEEERVNPATPGLWTTADLQLSDAVGKSPFSIPVPPAVLAADDAVSPDGAGVAGEGTAGVAARIDGDRVVDWVGETREEAESREAMSQASFEPADVWVAPSRRSGVQRYLMALQRDGE